MKTRRLFNTRTYTFSVNVLAPLNIAAVLFGGKWVLSILGISVTWGQFLVAALVTLGIWIVANVKHTFTWQWQR